MNSTSEPLPKTAPPVRTSLDTGAIVALLFVFSGAAALIYQVGFIRAFVELYGSSSAALGAVVAGFLVCLAAGAFLVARFADRVERPLQVYAILEAVAAAGGLLGFLVLGRLEPIATALARQPHSATLDGLRFVLALAVLLIPVGALGGTLPLLARLRNLDRDRGVAAGGLQVANTVGAVLGVFAATLWLLPALGLQGSIGVAALMNAAIALCAVLLGRRRSDPVLRSAQAASTDASEPRVMALPFLLAATLTGAYVVGMEVLLFRGLAQVARGSLESLGSLLAAFLLAQAVGTALGSWLSRRHPQAGFVLGHALAALAACTACGSCSLSPRPLLDPGC
jgi:MFS family permease